MGFICLLVFQPYKRTQHGHNELPHFLVKHFVFFVAVFSNELLCYKVEKLLFFAHECVFVSVTKISHEALDEFD